MAAALDIEEVKVAYGSTTVLKGVTLNVAPGEFVALLGSSGCGKTTLLRAICGFVPVKSGAIKVDGRDIAGDPPDQRNMAMVFQSYALWPHMTAGQNIAYGLKLRGWDRARIDARVAEMLAMLKLNDLGERKPAELSGGQRQRVALGRALAISPTILLLDEPLSNLDARIREEVRHEIKALQKTIGITTIHVTHDREEAMVMADRIVVMDQGRIAQQGAPEDIYNQPNSPFVANFLGAVNVVRVNGTVTGDVVEIAAGPHNTAARLKRPAGRPLSSGPMIAHFRSEAAKLIEPGAAADGLVLRGKLTQSAYPGGFWRFTVRVGDRQYLVDDERSFVVGREVAIHLPPEALQLFNAPETAGHIAVKQAV